MSSKAPLRADSGAASAGWTDAVAQDAPAYPCGSNS